MMSNRFRVIVMAGRYAPVFIIVDRVRGNAVAILDSRDSADARALALNSGGLND